MKRLVICALALLCWGMTVHAQEGLVQLVPAGADGDSEVKIIYDATKGASALQGASKVYMHSGVILSGPGGNDWQHVIGNWGMDDGIGEMTPVAGETDKWEITLSPTVRDYYEVGGADPIFRLAMVFRNADGSKEGKGTPGTWSWGNVSDAQDIFVDLKVNAYVQITSPQESEIFINSGEAVHFSANASSAVSQMTMQLDEGDGSSTVAQVNSGTGIAYDYSPTSGGNVSLTVEATINGEVVDTERTYTINLVNQGNEVPLPAGVRKGINYISATEVVLVLEAPLKEFVYAVGDFSDWQTWPEYLMNKAPDTDLFWVRITGLVPEKKYVFQYWIDGAIKIGDPYAAEVADKDNDPYIPASVFPDPAAYTRDYGIASVLQTAQPVYSWDTSEDSWEAPEKNDLIIYELLIRDFLGTHSFNDLLDTLDYLDRLHINAIELMPVMEFEGNSSWGYNPSYFFALDKYYGTKNAFKQFVEEAHRRGIAVIMDMVLNHAFGQNALVKMYPPNGPTNPWFNATARHPYNVGYDFNHESPYTQAFVDSVNNFWVTEFHIDGYRYDLSKGFTQTNYCTTPGCDTGAEVGAWSSYDASRIAILKRMANALWEKHPDTYVILEHFAETSEENELASAGMMLWNNRNFTYGEALAGITSGNFSGAESMNRVTYMESHDEERTMYEAYQKGIQEGSYDAGDTLIDLERQKMNVAFLFLLPGPKMIWQFGELGYDVILNGSGSNGRLAEKPLPWGNGSLHYYDDQRRQYLYEAVSAILELRNSIQSDLAMATISYDLNDADRRIVIDGADEDILVAGNYGITPMMITPEFSHTGMWYDYFSGEEVSVDDLQESYSYAPGEFHIYTDHRMSDGFPEVVKVYQDPVVVSPASFTASQEITIRFDANKADPAGTAGLIGADRIFMYSGTVLNGPGSKHLEHVMEGAATEMTRVEGESDIWEITLTPTEYYALTEGETLYRIGVYFQNQDGDLLGKGFRGETIYLKVQPEGDMITVTPADFSQTDEITLVYDARFGPLATAENVYMHSGVVLTDKAAPTGSDWKHVVGTWGTDNGIGKMSAVSGEPGKWQITMTPKSYYGLTGGQQAYWLAMLFRNTDGSVKGAGDPDQTTNELYVAANGDIYVKIPDTQTVTGNEDRLERDSMQVFPNPGSERVHVRIPYEQGGVIRVISSQGQTVVKRRVSTETEWNVKNWNAGIYLIIFTRSDGYNVLRKLIVAP